MVINGIVALIITGVLGVIIIVFSVILISGRGAFLIAGYNTVLVENKKKLDTDLLCRFVGKVLLPIGITTPAVALGGMYHIGWLPSAYMFLVVGLILFAAIWANTGNRFRK